MISLRKLLSISVASKHTSKHKLDNSHKHSGIPADRRALIKRKRRLNFKINCLKYLNHSNKTPNMIEKSLKKLNSDKTEIESAIKNSILNDRRKKEDAVLEKIKTNPKAFYTFAKQNSKVKCRIGPLKDSEGRLSTDPQEMSDILQDQYKNVFSNPDEKTNINIETNNQYSGIDSIELTEDDFVKAINLVSSSAASGPDKFPISILKECKHQLAKPLCLIWTRSLETGEIPSKYLEQTIVPIFKKGNKSDPANYRPVSLTSHIIKLVERIIRRKLMDYSLVQNVWLRLSTHFH